MVIFIILTMTGLGLMYTMTVSHFLDIAPPTVVVSSRTYPGAIAEAGEKTVTVPLETKINGVEDMIYMSSVSTINGVSKTTVTFDVWSKTEMAVVNTLTRNNLAILPSELIKKAFPSVKNSEHSSSYLF